MTSMAEAANAEEIFERVAARRHRRPIWRRYWRHRVAVASVTVLVLAIAIAILAPLIAPYNPTETDLGNRLNPPVWFAGGGHVLGTDHLGRDVLSRVIWGARVSLMVGFSGVISACLFGVLLGVLAGYYRGAIDEVIMRIADIQMAFPALALAIVVIAVLGPGLTNVVITLAISGWILYARIVRADVLSIREKEFILAERALGAGDFRIIRYHVLPNIVSSIIVTATFTFATMVITEASLSFLGLGVQPPTPTWGGMLNDARDYLNVAWWLATMPGLALLIVTLAVNTLGDWLRDELDPRLRLD